MFDFPFHEATVGTSVFCLIYYLVLVRSNYRDGLLDPFAYEISLKKEVLTIFLLGVFTITHCLEGDFFHLMHHVYDYSFVPGSYNFGEEIYHKIAFFVDKNYFLFRTIVWGGAFCLFCLTAKRMNVSVYYSVVLLIATHIITFCYARATAAMAVYFFGLSFLCSPLKNKLISYILGILIIYFSLKFHSSAIVMLIMGIMIIVPIRRWSIIFVIIAFFLLSNIFKDLLLEIASSENTDAIVANKIDYYSQRVVKHGLSGIINSALQYASFYIPFVIATIDIFNDDNFDSIPTSIYRMYKVASGFVLSSLLFYFLGPSFITFVYRVLFMSMIPMTIVVVYLYQSGFMSNSHYRWCVFSGIIYNVVMYLYVIYVTSLSS